jgi:hypothetical protein
VSYLQLEHAGSLGLLERRVLGALLEQAIELHNFVSMVGALQTCWRADLKQFVIAGLGLELAAVLDGLLELGSLGGGHFGLLLLRWFC